MSECSPSACATCPWHEIEEQLKKNMKEARDKAEKKQAEQAEKAAAEKE